MSQKVTEIEFELPNNQEDLEKSSRTAFQHNGIIKIAYDIDGTVIDYEGNPREDIIAILKMLQSLGCQTICWSMGGPEYTQNIVDYLGLKDITVLKKGAIEVDLTFDDNQPFFGKVNIKVPKIGEKVK